MSNIYHLLPRLIVNSRFIDEFISAQAPCFALGLVEERKQTCGFLALRPKGDTITSKLLFLMRTRAPVFGSGIRYWVTPITSWFTLPSISTTTRPSTYW